MDRNILAGMFATTNLGLGLDSNLIESALRDPPANATAAAYHFCAHLMEDENGEEVIVEEAVSWWDKLHAMPDEEIERIWPHTVIAYRAAEKALA